MKGMLAIDQSTSATKAVLFDEHAGRMATETEAHAQRYPCAGWVEHDAEEIWGNVLAVTRRLLARERDVDLRYVSIANQRETVVAFEKGTGRPLAPAIVWQCRRGDALCARQVTLGRGPEIRRRTGLRVNGYFSAPKLEWLLEQRPDIAGMCAAGEALLGTVDAYLVYRLTEGRVFATDSTNASRTLLFDIHRLTWDRELCRWWGVPPEALPEVRSSEAGFGETDLGGVLAEPIPIRGVMGDSQAALFGHGCERAGSGKVTLGTGASVMINVGDTAPSPLLETVAALAWVHAGRPTYAAEGIINSSGSALTWLRDQLGLLSSVAESAALSAQVRDDQAVYLVPAFSGLGSPYWRDDARAAIVGLSSQSDRRHVIKAALECVAFQLRDVLETMARDTGVALERIRVDGGTTGNSYLMQFVADILGIEVVVADQEGSAALGAALMGARGLGVDSMAAALAATAHPQIAYRPSMRRSEADTRYAGWRRALEQVISAKQ